MTNYREQVATAVRAAAIHSPNDFSWFGKHSPPYPRRLVRAFTSTTARTLLLFDLQNLLYSDFYCRGGAAAAQDETTPVLEVETADFVAELAAAWRSKGSCANPGWRVRLLQEDRVLVRRGDMEVWARRQDCVNGRASLAPGRQVGLRVPREAPTISPDFYSVMGKAPWPDRPGALIRFYWNLTVEGALRFLRVATTVLDRAAVPFSLKVANHPIRYNRCDAGVLYLREEDYDAVSDPVARIFAELAPFLKQGTPALTKALAPGLAWAEDPGNSDTTMQLNSFGTHRCYLLADGLIRAYEKQKTSLAERMQAVETRFREEGVSLEEPFRNFRRRQSCKLEHLAAQLHSCRRVKTASQGRLKNVLLRSAQEIGQHIAADAIWDGSQCNWLGAALPMAEIAREAQDFRYAPLGVDLYSGTAGVALFLAELCVDGGKDFRRTAIGAIRQSLQKADTVRAGTRLGFYTGWTGIAYAAARVGQMTGESEWVERSDQLVRRMIREEGGLKGFDLISGKAGAIVGLLSLQEVLKNIELLETAAWLGEKLFREAEWVDGCCSWKSHSVKSYRNLTGFAQGVAGAAYALLELFRATGEAKFRKTAVGGLQYERQKFDREACNWPDFRLQENQPRSARRSGAHSFGNCWSHGAPGIALSRLHAFEILKDESYKREAICAVRTIRQSLDDWRKSYRGNWSLSEGLAGNCEALLCARETLGRELGPEHSVVTEIVQEACRNYAERDHHWPCATQAGEAPGLMLGLAGVGYLCLRLSNPKIPSVLALTR